MVDRRKRNGMAKEIVEAGTSRLTEDPSMHAGGLSLDETLLAAAAGSLIGGMFPRRISPPMSSN